LVQWHPHAHPLTTDGAFSNDGTFHALESWDGEAVMRLFRERLFVRLVERHAISDELARKLVAWTHPGFSAHIGEAIPFENKKAIEDLACYLVRAPLSLQKLVYLDGHKAVLYRSRMNPSLGRNFEAMDPLEWLARLADHIPDPGRHRTHFCAHYAKRVRGERPGEEQPRPADETKPPTRRRSAPPASPHKGGGVRGQGSHGDHTRLQRAPDGPELRRTPCWWRTSTGPSTPGGTRAADAAATGSPPRRRGRRAGASRSAPRTAHSA